MEEVTTKTCKQYNIEKPITDFHTDKRSRDGHRVICKQCVKENLNSKKKKTNTPTTEEPNADRNGNGTQSNVPFSFAGCMPNSAKTHQFR